MATAVETGSQARAQVTVPNLPRASLIGAIYVLASLAAVMYFIPAIWVESGSTGLGSFMLRVAAQIAAFVALCWFGASVAGSNPPKGMRAGIFIIAIAAVVIFFIAHAIAQSADARLGSSTAQIVTAAVAIVIVFFFYRLFTSPRGGRSVVGLEDQGWFSTKPYKRALGQKVRRLTVLGILLLGGTGIYSLIYQHIIPETWVITLPFGGPTFTILNGADYAVPILLAALTFWIAYRIVNLPTFAEFLIATEAEMNKVSWSSRKSLVQDTILVLVTTICMALFLLFVDIFWGWLLSTQTVGVLPPKTTEKQKEVKPVNW